MHLNASQVISFLALTPSMEGGFYRQTFQDPQNVTTSSGTTDSASTQIYYLLQGCASPSSWHRVRDAPEVWHHYDGAPLILSLSYNDGKPVRNVTLGKDLVKGQRPQVVVGRDEWQRATSLGDWTLVGCTVAPGFTFGEYEMMGEGWMPRGA
jgi:predicted cupin superfamily sugar epimerase